MRIVALVLAIAAGVAILAGYFIPAVRHVETIMPDHDQVEQVAPVQA